MTGFLVQAGSHKADRHLTILSPQQQMERTPPLFIIWTTENAFSLNSLDLQSQEFIYQEVLTNRRLFSGLRSTTELVKPKAVFVAMRFKR